MKKFFCVILLAVAMLFSTTSVQAQSNFDLNKNFHSQMEQLSNVYNGVVVNVQTYLSIREQPSTYSREVMRV